MTALTGDWLPCHTASWASWVSLSRKVSQDSLALNFSPTAAQEGGGGAFSSWHQLSSPATSLPWVRVGLGGALCGFFKATFGVLNSLCLSGVHLMWRCGTFPGLLAWGWQEGTTQEMDSIPRACFAHGCLFQAPLLSVSATLSPLCPYLPN